MPLYEFQCKRCEEVYEELAKYDEMGKYKGIKCPECGSTRKKRLMSSSSFNFTNPEDTGRWNNERTGHDYRYKHKQPAVRKVREDARRESHVGPTPYVGIDDVSSGRNFGEVK